MDKNTPAIYFELFNEIAIIQQLSRAALEAQLPDGFLQPHFAVVNHLNRGHDGGTPLVISRAFQLPKTTMSHTLSGLEKHGLIEMRPNPKDGRSKCVWLTDQGRAFRGETIEKLGGYMAGGAEHFDQQQIAATLATLKQLRVYLDENR